MTITHETTIEEYEAWLSTYPSFSKIRQVTNQVFRSLYASLNRLKKCFGRVAKHRSCLSPRRAYTIFPVEYCKNQNSKLSSYDAWVESIAIELSKTRKRLERMNMFDCLSDKPWAAGLINTHNERIAKLEDEIGKEEVLHTALEILNKN